MRLGTLEDLRHALGGTKAPEKPVVGTTYACALKKAAGLAGVRMFDIERALRFRRANPGWKVTDVYPPTAAVTSNTSSGRKR